MALIEFVRNTEDLSTDRGYQFRFHCDKCGSGWVSEFEISAVGVGGSILRAAGGLFGGILGTVANNEYEVRKLVQGKGHDDALNRAVQAGKARFKKCTRCGKWVCPETCWNVDKGLCEECAPNLMEEAAAAQARASVEQIQTKARTIDYTKDVDLVSNVTLSCPACNAQVPGGKFCPECGAKLLSTTRCTRCGTDMKTGTKFCPECGEKTA